MEFVVNFAFGFFSFCLIMFVVFFAQTNRIKKILAQASKEELESLQNLYVDKYEDKEENEINVNTKWNEDLEKESIEIPKKSKFFSSINVTSIKNGFKMFFIPLRIFAYVIFVVGFFILLRNDYLNLAGLFVGVFVANVFVVFVLALKDRAN